MAQYDFTIHYDGDGLANNRIPIRDLAPLFACSINCISRDTGT